MHSDSEDEAFHLLAQRRYYLTSVVIAVQIITNLLLVFSVGWILIIFNLPSFLGAMALFTNHLEDIQFNKKGIQMYLIGYIKAIFMVLMLVLTYIRIDGLEEMGESEQEKLQFFKTLKILCELNSLCDLVYSLLGVCIIKFTRDIMIYLKEKEQWDISSFMSDERTNTLLANLSPSRIEMRILRE